MIELDDHFWTSVEVIYSLWKNTPGAQFAILSPIPDSLSLDELRNFLNAKLFYSGILSSRAYRALYKLKPHIGENYLSSEIVKMRLDEMFTGGTFRARLINRYDVQ